MVEPVVRRTVELDAPALEVWHLLTDPAELRTWFAADVDLVATPGATGLVLDHDGTTRHVVVDVLDAEHRLDLTWWPTDLPEAASTISFTLDEQGGRTLLTVTETPVVRAGGMVCRSREAADPWTGRLLGLELAVLTRVGAST